MIAARARWINAPGLSAGAAAGLDQMRATRAHILNNANTNLAFDVMFGRLIALRGGAAHSSKRT